MPQLSTSTYKLRSLDLSHNQLEVQYQENSEAVKVSKGLIMKTIEFNDAFPCWLGSLPEGQVFILRKNGIHGTLGTPNSKTDFTSNFGLWKGMNVSDSESLRYMKQDLHWDMYFANANLSGYYNHSMTLTMTNKGTELGYQKISNSLTAINLSGNKFNEMIPDSIGGLRGLRVLDLSNNSLTGDLKLLESMDLSQNVLSGQIPHQRAKMTFSVYLNVSDNHPLGQIPQGAQFDTFQQSSFPRTPGLMCGISFVQKM
ncbi:hypothetical protein Cgig2_008095 [Carnegiea gigantea]|uniref:Uncharacterized protein n=1 Tax=Carnegiea gigantea TaxID=171969 RepID=A0A9Q1QTQ1_9CARY|nr:hypothetical protein Cgig2_008095 [Carnegiea gigantea]